MNSDWRLHTWPYRHRRGRSCPGFGLNKWKFNLLEQVPGTLQVYKSYREIRSLHKTECGMASSFQEACKLHGPESPERCCLAWGWVAQAELKAGGWLAGVRQPASGSRSGKPLLCAVVDTGGSTNYGNSYVRVRAVSYPASFRQTYIRLTSLEMGCLNTQTLTWSTDSTTLLQQQAFLSSSSSKLTSIALSAVLIQQV